jgi:uncharacterized protein (DUF885 family)
VLKSGAAVAALTAFDTPLARAADASPSAASKALSQLFDDFMAQYLDASPEEATTLGLDVGARAAEKAKLDDRSLAGIAANRATVREQIIRLQLIDRDSLTGMDAVNYDVMFYTLQTADTANRLHEYGNGGIGADDGPISSAAGIPYVISQLTGTYSYIPDFLDSRHTIETKADADAYLARLEAFAVAMDQDAEVARHDAGLGVIPPDFSLTQTLVQLNALRGVAADQSVLTTSVARRAKEKNIAGDYGADAAKIVAEKVYPALDRQIALVRGLQPRATHEAGVWKFPDGDSYYADSLTYWTTSSMGPAEIHKAGLDVVQDYTARIGEIMKSQGMTQGTVGERLRALYSDPKFRYPNTDEGKEKLIADLNKKVQAVRARLPQYFGVLPKADVVLKRIPKYSEAGQPGGYYLSPSLDGARPGAYYINLRDTAEVPSWVLPTFTYHESIPGHHLQGTIQLETNLPMVRKVSFFSAYLEGWALYAEQLADEMGMYEGDPFGRIGYMHDAMFRGVRLVVDTGMHAMRWTREQAIKFYVDALGDQDASAVTEVERYCVWPGQACSYMLGKLTFLRLRDKARAALGPRFDIRDFHDAVLLCGAVPLTVLDDVVDNYIAAKKG